MKIYFIKCNVSFFIRLVRGLRFCITLIILLIPFSGKTQRSPKQSVYIELGGVNTIYSINYERLLNAQSKWTPYIHAGFGYLGKNSGGINTSLQFLKKSERKVCIQIGVGLAYNNNKFLNKDVSVQGMLGLRRKFKCSYLLFAINPSLHYFFNDSSPLAAQFLYPSIGYGYYLK